MFSNYFTEQLFEGILIASFQGGWNTNLVIIGTTILGVSAGLLGIFVVLRKEAMSVDAISHGTLPGVALSFMLMSTIGGSGAGAQGKNILFLLVGAFFSCVLASFTIFVLKHYTKLKEDAAIAISLSSYFGLGILLLSYIQVYDLQNAAGIKSYIFGQAAAMSRFDIILMSGVLLLILTTLLLIFKELVVSSFDKDFTNTIGIKTSLIDTLIYILVILFTVVGIQAVGMLLILSLLVIPPVTARLWTNKIIKLSYLSAFIGGLSSFFGAILSSLHTSVPAGAIIVLVSGVVFLFSFIFAPERGLLSGLIRQLSLRAKITGDHLLLENYESLLKLASINNEDKSYKELRLFGRYLDTLSYYDYFLSSCWLFINKYGGLHFAGLKLSEKGYNHAALLSRNNKLWKTYITLYGNISQTHVNYSADLVEHVLKPEVVKELELLLSKEGHLQNNTIDSKLTKGSIK